MLARSSVAIYSGTSGWVYRSWRDQLYADAPMRQWLAIASRTFGSLEINGSFYTQISTATYARWARETPPGFRFGLKAHRYITHFKRLRDCADSVARQRDRADALGDKLGAVVWQLPSTFRIDLDRLSELVDALGSWRVRHAIELRHRSWFVPDVARRLARANIAVCLSDAPDFPMWNTTTADFVYVRLHGHTRKYTSRYSAASLARWARDAQRWHADGRDVFVYFDNDAAGHAVHDARAFAGLVGARS